uniref:Variant surface glycoprotein n=1 Tax=Trypanosoma brucei TaxID=5691 RepID=A0A1J0R7D7_9TRYP|nr:variant surface glycoprotein 1125.1478 [Trypanosoma brucei]ARB50587.1 variant surface glycoprotein [Trypanosoma brucei]
MMMRATTVATLLVLTLHAARQTAANKKAIKVQGFQKMCTLSKKLKTVQAYATNRLKQWRTQIADINELHEDLTILTKKLRKVPEVATITLIRLLKHEAKVLDQKYRSLAESAPLAATVSGQTAGAMDEATGIFYAATKNGASGKYCLEQDSSVSKVDTATDLAGCITEESAPVAAAADTAAVEVKPSYITTKWTGGQITNAVGTGSDCLLTQTDGNGGYIDANGMASGIKWAGGLLQFRNSQLTGNTWTGTSTSLTSIPVLNAAAQQLTTISTKWHHTSAAIDNLLKLKEPTEQTFTDIDTNENILNAGGQDKALKVTKVTKEQLEQIIKKVNNYREPLACGGKLEERRNSFHLQELTTNTTVTIEKVNAECNKDTQGKESYETKEEDCNKAKDDKTECGNKNGCTYDDSKQAGKKCILSEETKQTVREGAVNQEEKDGKPASERCTRHTRKEDCEKENERLAAGDNEDKCKDYSVLVNQKLALSMAVACMSLLLFGSF